MQRYGKRSEALSKAAIAAKKHTVARATYTNKAGENNSAGIAQPSTGFDASQPNHSVQDGTHTISSVQWDYFVSD